MALSDAPVSWEIDADGIATVTLDDPTTSNALSEHTVGLLVHAFDLIGRDPACKVVVLTAVGDTFSSGAPADVLRKLVRGEGHPTEITLPRALLGCPVPVIAAAAGHGVGGGFALALAADVVILSSEHRYGFTFMNYGFTPGMGTTRLSEHVLSPAVAHELLYTGELRRGAAFATLGGVNRVLPGASVRGAAYDIARRIAEKPRPALELLKRTLSLPRRTAFEEALAAESLMHQLTMRAPAVLARLETDYL